MCIRDRNETSNSQAPRNFALAFLLVDFVLMLVVFSRMFDGQDGGLQLVERVSWIPFIGLEWSLGADGLSAPLVVLSGLITLLAVAASWKVQSKTRLYFALLLVQASAQGLVFLSQDFLLFFLAWELACSGLPVNCHLGRKQTSICRHQIHSLHRSSVFTDSDQRTRSGTFWW